MLDAVVVPGRDGFPAVHAGQGRDGVGAGARRRRVRVRQVVADARQIPVRAEAGQIFIEEVGIHRIAAEHAVIFDTQLLGCLVQDQDN